MFKGLKIGTEITYDFMSQHCGNCLFDKPHLSLFAEWLNEKTEEHETKA